MKLGNEILKTIIPSTKISISENNVLAVIGDQKLPVLQGGVVVSFEAHVISSQDYSPFGVTLSGRSWSEGYRYGFNGKEKDDNTFEGAYDFGARILDTRLGKFSTIDAAWKNLVSLSPFVYAADNPIMFIDSNGNLVKFPETHLGEISQEQLLFIEIYQNSTDEYKAELDKLISSDMIYEIEFVSKEVINGNGDLTSLSNELDECQEEQLVIKIQINRDINPSMQTWAMGDELQSGINFENNYVGFAQKVEADNFSTLAEDLKDEWLTQLAGCEAFNQLSSKYPDKIKEQDLVPEQRSLNKMYNEITSGDPKNSLYQNNAKALVWFSTGRARVYKQSIGGTISDFTSADQGGSDLQWSKILESSGLSRVVFKRGSDSPVTDIKR